ncbi:hypothetical protein LEP1GSC024_3119 [Leptospira noguchii str. 2001034031]|uniref:Uncharacterized protein n=1 Tax=Leptospira noguchii str. 2001034031 TaxID=1193053 RepID=M6YCC5_9LEPT|nr:hypothetical protein LEP1GSC024_3119 [Leptospira noguchii str. 2001034031]
MIFLRGTRFKKLQSDKKGVNCGSLVVFQKDSFQKILGIEKIVIVQISKTLFQSTIFMK